MMLRDARRKANLSIEAAADELHIAARTLVNYESGASIPPPEVVLAMTRLYSDPWLAPHYCRHSCAIGQAYGYAVLDAAKTDPASVMLKLAEELTEAQGVLHQLLRLTVNRNSRADFRPEEWTGFAACLHEFLDVEHTIAVLKVSLGQWFDVADLVQEHNDKCVRHGYCTEEVAA